MSVAEVGRGLQSLADLIGGLRQGDGCPWCGGRLKSTAGRYLVSSGTLFEARRDMRPEVMQGVLVCPDCGSEVYSAVGDMTERTCNSLDTAA